MKNSVIVLTVIDSILLAGGIILILIPCIQYNNWWPLITIFVHFFAILFPVTCGGCNISGNSDDLDFRLDSSDPQLAIVSWVFVGVFVVLGYAIPAILLRARKIPEAGLLFAFGGGTLILISILVFVRVVYFKKDPDHAYLF